MHVSTNVSVPDKPRKLTLKPRIQVSTNVSVPAKPRKFIPTKLNDTLLYIMCIRNITTALKMYCMMVIMMSFENDHSLINVYQISHSYKDFQYLSFHNPLKARHRYQMQYLSVGVKLARLYNFHNFPVLPYRPC